MLQHHARPGIGSYIHPLRIGPRHLCLTEDSPWHHPHQHGIQTRFVGINGSDFWHFPGQRPGKPVGRINPGLPRITGTEPPRWVIEALWQHADGRHVLADRQEWQLGRAGACWCSIWTGRCARFRMRASSRTCTEACTCACRTGLTSALRWSLRPATRTATPSSSRPRGWTCTCRSIRHGVPAIRRRAPASRCSTIRQPGPSRALAGRRPARHQSRAQHRRRHRPCRGQRAAPSLPLAGARRPALEARLGELFADYAGR